mmetsp:Transcript_5818/g.22018  ORF Transcript_5818/g.22018 Transcript_5818/m.22018 type:complete len:203 (+) Transcript_5818:405-1013(+)
MSRRPWRARFFPRTCTTSRMRRKRWRFSRGKGCPKTKPREASSWRRSNCSERFAARRWLCSRIRSGRIPRLRRSRAPTPRYPPAPGRRNARRMTKSWAIWKARFARRIARRGISRKGCTSRRARLGSSGVRLGSCERWFVCSMMSSRTWRRGGPTRMRKTKPKPTDETDEARGRAAGPGRAPAKGNKKPSQALLLFYKTRNA